MNKKPVPVALPRIQRFESMGLGLFVHYGLYSQLGAGEWVELSRKLRDADYVKLAQAFTAEDFDGAALAKLARQGGMRYACLTTRHHEGFSLFDTRGLNEFDAPHSGAGRDLVAEFVEACRSEGIVPFFYHTTLDWRWDTQHCDQARFDEYLDYLNASIEILCTQYGEIGGLWFDGNWSRPGADWKEDRLYGIIRQHQPEAIIINNSGLSNRGATGHPELDSRTFEQGLPSAPDRAGWPKYLAGEMCETLNSHWGLATMDFALKGPATIIEHLCACRKVGANYLLNVGPSATGAIADYETSLIHLLGRWIATLGDLIYEGRPVRAICRDPDFLLKKGKNYYYFAHTLHQQGSGHVVTSGVSSGPRSITGLTEKIRSVRWLDDKKPLPFLQSERGDFLTIDCLGYDYGTNLVVRVAELEVA
ncbi:hypothetical protein BH09VER1_BH09VER1_47870 [soil metagenome]